MDLDANGRLEAITLKPLGEIRGLSALLPKLEVSHVALADSSVDAPVAVTAGSPAAVHLVGVFTVASMEFTPGFEIDTLRVEPAAKTVRLQVALATTTGGADESSSFDLAEVQLGDGAQIRGARLLPAQSGHA